MLSFSRIFKIISFLSTTLILLLIYHFFHKDFVYQNENGSKKKITIKKARTITDAQKEFGSKVKTALTPSFEKCGLTYPPPNIAFLFFKQEKKMELWAKKDTTWVLVKHYPILASSGTTGPKLKEGDLQTPEGIYKIELLNPNSSYHLSMKINYPNFFDQSKAKIEGRENLGGNIFIHGKSVSIGCLAMGDDAAEELFILANLVGLKNICVIIAPKDSRPKPLTAILKPNPHWVPELYTNIDNELKQFTVKK